MESGRGSQCHLSDSWSPKWSTEVGLEGSTTGQKVDNQSTGGKLEIEKDRRVMWESSRKHG